MAVAKLFALTDIKRQCLKDVVIDSPASGSGGVFLNILHILHSLLTFFISDLNS